PRQLSASTYTTLFRSALGGEALGQKAGLHRAVADHPGVVARAPRDLPLQSRAIDQGERRLQRVHVPNRFRTVEQTHVEVRHAARERKSTRLNSSPGTL